MKIAAFICYGQLDVDVSADFRTEVQAIRQVLSNSSMPEFDFVYSSPLQRCRLLAEAMGFKPVIEGRLMEMNFGRWEGQAWDAIDRGELDVWGADYFHQAPPGGESLREMCERVKACLNEFADNKHKRILLITHAGVIRVCYHLLNNIALMGKNTVFNLQIAYGSLHRFEMQASID